MRVLQTLTMAWHKYALIAFVCVLVVVMSEVVKGWWRARSLRRADRVEASKAWKKLSSPSPQRARQTPVIPEAVHAESITEAALLAALQELNLPRCAHRMLHQRDAWMTRVLAGYVAGGWWGEPRTKAPAGKQLPLHTAAWNDARGTYMSLCLFRSRADDRRSPTGHKHQHAPSLARKLVDSVGRAVRLVPGNVAESESGELNPWKWGATQRHPFLRHCLTSMEERFARTDAKWTLEEQRAIMERALLSLSPDELRMSHYVPPAVLPLRAPPRRTAGKG